MHAVAKEIVVASLLIPYTVSSQLVQLHEWKDIKSVFVYLSMPWELSSKAMVGTLFGTGHRVYVPRIVGKESKDMKVVSIYICEVETLVPHHWTL